jgi:hypothetical protein
MKMVNDNSPYQNEPGVQRDVTTVNNNAAATSPTQTSWKGQGDATMCWVFSVVF